MELVEDNAVYREYPMGNVIVKEYLRPTKLIGIEYDGANLLITTHDDPYTGEIALIVNGQTQTVAVHDGIASYPFSAGEYDIITASLDGYIDGRLELGVPPAPPDRVTELETKVAQLQAKNDELVLIVGDLALGQM